MPGSPTWRPSSQPRPPVRPGRGSVDAFDLSALGSQPRAEVAYVLQCRHDDRAIRIPPNVVRHLVGLLSSSGATSLLDRPLDLWLDAVRSKGHRDPSRTIGLVRYAHRRLSDLDGDHDVEDEYASDRWEAARLGLRLSRPPRSVRFDGIAQPWLRAATKRWARHRLGSGKAFSSITVDVRAIRWFARYVLLRCPDAVDERAVTRELLEGYLAWLTGSGLAPHTRNTRQPAVSTAGVEEHPQAHKVGAATAALYGDEPPGRPDDLPRFIPEYVMVQLERPERLAQLPDTTSRHLVVVLMETGLRANDACVLPFNPIIDDSVGWPCLRYYNAKMSAEQLVPLSARAAEAIRAQQEHVRQRWPSGTPCLFPAATGNPDGLRPFSYATLRQRLARWQEVIDLRDEAGRPYRATAHQFRHTLGTRLKLSGVALDATFSRSRERWAARTLRERLAA